MIQVTELPKYINTKGSRIALTIGNFDGCHLGHQELTQTCQRYGAQLGAPATVMTFSPRPEAFFRSTEREVLLFTAEQKTRAFAELGLQLQLVQPFDADFSRVTATDFYDRLLRSQLNIGALVVGDNFHFGYQRVGDVAYLQERTSHDDVRLTVGVAVQHAGQRISSTRIRETLYLNGDVTAAALMLGRPYLLEGNIEQGDQLGRRIGSPTANLGGTDQLIPRFGVYAGYVWLGDNTNGSSRPPVMSRAIDAVPAVFNIGVRPTLAQSHPPTRIEAHLLTGTYGDNALYGRRAGYYFAHRLRGEQAFANLEALQEQIRRDADHARHLLGCTRA